MTKDSRTPPKDVINIIIKRDELLLKDKISKHFLHYSPHDVDLTSEFKSVHLDTALAKSKDFLSFLDSQLNKYLQDKLYDPISVCCAVRNLIEKHCYQQLSTDEQTEFLETHTTTKKLDYAMLKGIDLPDRYFLLSVIYNEAAHINPKADILTPLFSKLGNLTIKHMISETVSRPS